MGSYEVIVLDTHILVWWVNGDGKLTRAARRAIDDTRAQGEPLLASSISAWEIAMLVTKNRLTLTMEVTEWLATAALIDAVQFVPVDNAVGIQAVRLPFAFHADPADRMIVALARRLSVPLVTLDQRIQVYKHVRTTG